MNKSQIKRMVTIALLMAIVVVLQMLSGMLPKIAGVFSLSLVLIPIVLGAAFCGVRAGALLGGAFGVIVFINCVTGADPGGAMVFQANPILCFLVVMGKGVACGAAAGLVYKLVGSRNDYLGMLLAAVVCPVVNTGIFIVCMLTFFNDVLAAWANGQDMVGYILSGLVLVNFVPELILNIAFSPASVNIGRAVLKR